MDNLPNDTPEGYVLKNTIISGKSKSNLGLFEIKFHRPTFRNAFTVEM